MGPFYAHSGTKVSASMVTLVLLLTAVPRSIGQAESVARGWPLAVRPLGSAQASGEANHYVWNAIRRRPHPLRPTCAGTAPPLWAGGLAGLSFGPGTRSQEWSESARGAAARGALRTLRLGRGLWHHCPHFVAWGLRGRALYGGRHRAALLVCVTLALLRATSLAATETWMLTRRQIELNEVRSRDPQLWDWANRAVRGTRMPLQYPAPIGFTATESSHLHLQLPDGTTLCRHAQGQARASNRLRNAYSTSDRHEAVAWQRPICDECFRRASASFWPVV